ncbi:hypothetical protein GGR77_001529 [Xanthomonas translucens]
MKLEDELKPFQTVDLAAEVARRLGASPQAAARREPAKPRKKRSVWARERVEELKASLERVRMDSVTGDAAVRRKETSIATLTEEIAKFGRIAAAAEKKGE